MYTNEKTNKIFFWPGKGRMKIEVAPDLEIVVGKEQMGK